MINNALRNTSICVNEGFENPMYVSLRIKYMRATENIVLTALDRVTSLLSILARSFLIDVMLTPIVFRT